MIDFVKIDIPFYPREKLLKNSNLDFKSNYSLSTGEIEQDKVTAEYKGMKFISLSTNRLIVQGSLHKYYNFLNNNFAPNQISKEQKTKGFNGNTFNLTQLKYAVNHLCRLNNINPKQAVLRNFEYGLNIQINNDCQIFLNSLIRHKNKEFSSVKDISQYYRQVKNQRFIIKCYDKQIQYQMPMPIIRFENKQIKMIGLINLPIKCLADLTIKENLESLKHLLVKKWDEVLMYDFTIEISNLKGKERSKIKDLSNPLFWQSIKSNHTHRHKEKLKELSLKYGKNIKKIFMNEIIKQWDKQNQNCVTFNRLFKNENCVIFNHSDKGLILTQ